MGLITETKQQYKSVPEAVIEVLIEKTEPMHVKEIAEAIIEKYPDIEDRVKDIKKRVTVALVRGMQQELYERVGRNIYKLKPKSR